MNELNANRAAIFDRIDQERNRQNVKFGWIGHPTSVLPGDNPDAKGVVVMEELLEALLEAGLSVMRTLNDTTHRGEFNTEKLHTELIQTAACCVAWVESDLEKGQGEGA